MRIQEKMDVTLNGVNVDDKVLRKNVSDEVVFDNYLDVNEYSNNKVWTLTNDNYIQLTGSSGAYEAKDKINVYEYDVYISSFYDDVSIRNNIIIGNTSGSISLVTDKTMTDISDYFPISLAYQLKNHKLWYTNKIR